MKNNALCHCGKNKILNDAKPFWVGACHCSDCKKISGSAYMIYLAFKLEQINFTHKNSSEYNSSQNVIRNFCSTCGSPISFVYNNSKENVFLTIGIFDDPDRYEIQEHIFTERKMKHVILDKCLQNQNKSHAYENKKY
jgi:hypothetical protein